MKKYNREKAKSQIESTALLWYSKLKTEGIGSKQGRGMEQNAKSHGHWDCRRNGKRKIHHHKETDAAIWE